MLLQLQIAALKGTVAELANLQSEHAALEEDARTLQQLRQSNADMSEVTRDLDLVQVGTHLSPHLCQAVAKKLYWTQYCAHCMRAAPVICAT